MLAELFEHVPQGFHVLETFQTVFEDLLEVTLRGSTSVGPAGGVASSLLCRSSFRNHPQANRQHQQPRPAEMLHEPHPQQETAKKRESSSAACTPSHEPSTKGEVRGTGCIRLFHSKGEMTAKQAGFARPACMVLPILT